MPLPVLETPKYDLVIPSTKKKIKFRPFLVKEEKILMIAQESNDSDQITNAIKEIIENCTFNAVDVDSLASYDIEYIFIKLRAKSVGENVSLLFKCEHCGTENEVNINIDQLEIKYPNNKVENNIKLSDNVGITLKIPSLKEARFYNPESDVNEVLSSVIETIYNDTDVWSVKNIDKNEINTFIDSLSHQQLQKIEEFLLNQPTLSHTVKFKCHNCKKDNTIHLQGLQSFF